VSWVYYWRCLLDSTLIKLSVFEAKDLSTLAYSWRLSEPLGARDKVLRKLCTKFFDFINFVGEFLIFLWYFDYFCDFFRRCTIFSSTLLLASEDKNPDRNMVSTGNFVQLYPRSDINWLMKKKAVCRSAFLTIWHCIFRTGINKCALLQTVFFGNFAHSVNSGEWDFFTC